MECKECTKLKLKHGSSNSRCKACEVYDIDGIILPSFDSACGCGGTAHGHGFGLGVQPSSPSKTSQAASDGATHLAGESTRSVVYHPLYSSPDWQTSGEPSGEPSGESSGERELWDSWTPKLPPLPWYYRDPCSEETTTAKAQTQAAKQAATQVAKQGAKQAPGSPAPTKEAEGESKQIGGCVARPAYISTDELHVLFCCNFL